MYLKRQLLELQHAIILRALEIYAPLYHMTADEMISRAIESGYIAPFTEREVREYGK